MNETVICVRTIICFVLSEHKTQGKVVGEEQQGQTGRGQAKKILNNFRVSRIDFPSIGQYFSKYFQSMLIDFMEE